MRLEITNKVESGCSDGSGVECYFYLVSENVGIKMYRGSTEKTVEMCRKNQERGYVIGIAPKPGRKVLCINERYGFLTEVAHDIQSYEWEIKWIGQWYRIVEKFEAEFNKYPGDCHYKNVGLIDGKMVIIDWGELVIESGWTGTPCGHVQCDECGERIKNSDFLSVPDGYLCDTCAGVLETV